MAEREIRTRDLDEAVTKFAGEVETKLRLVTVGGARWE
jgi:hypothetical protein